MNEKKQEKRIVAIIQARMSSSRLPGKVLKEIAGKPMLSWVIERARRSVLLDDVCVATTEDESDDQIAEYCQKMGYSLYRGSLYDVLDRYYQAAESFSADVIVRLTADCPVIDPQVIDRVLQAFLDGGYDFAANRLPPPWKRTYPIGLDVEVCDMHGLTRTWREAKEKHQREHVMPYFYDQDGRFNIHVVDHETNYGQMRWTVDTPEDLEMVRQIFVNFPGREDFSWLEIVDLMKRKPELIKINQQVAAKDTRVVDERAQ